MCITSTLPGVSGTLPGHFNVTIDHSVYFQRYSLDLHDVYVLSTLTHNFKNVEHLYNVIWVLRRTHIDIIAHVALKIQF